MQLAESKRKFSLPFHVVKKLDISKKKYWLIKFIGIAAAFLLAGLICTILRPGTFATFYSQMFLGCFGFDGTARFNEFLLCFALLTLVAFALAPAFKMRFWNIGGEGQILVGCLVTAGILKFMGEAGISDGLIIPLALLAAIGAGIVWGAVPAIFKAFFGTNEVLFTLMMNYIAAGLIALMINVWVPNGSQVIGIIPYGSLPDFFNFKYIFGITIAIAIVTLITVYLKLTKHGYELSVVGESANTARYVGINVKYVTIRTMIVSGAVCGLVGFLLVSGYHHTLTATLAGGRGFTGVLIAWLGGFEPIQMILYSFLVSVFQRGSINAASYVNMNTEHFSAIVTGMFFLIVIATEFFVNYQVMLKKDDKKEDKLVSEVAIPAIEETPAIEEVPQEEKEIKEEPKKVVNTAKKSAKPSSKSSKGSSKSSSKTSATSKKANKKEAK